MTSLDAIAALDLLQQRRLSARELTVDCLAQIEQIDPAVNAIVTVVADRALAAADDVDARRARGEPVGPLAGLPVAIKDLQDTAGVTTTLGAFPHRVPERDAGIVARIRAADGIVVAKTNIPERSIGANTVNRITGATANPFDTERTCGGSSGGSAVALATGMAPLATGSDHGGSIRIPACYCGVVGHRATPGVVPFEERAMTQTFYSVQGPMARTVADAALLLSVIANRSSTACGHDPMVFPMDASHFRRLESVAVDGLRIGVSEDLGGVAVSAEVRASFRQRVDVLADRGADCVEVPLQLADGPEVDWRLRADVFATYYRGEAETWDDDFNPAIRATYDKALAMPVSEIAGARHRQMELYRHMADMVAGVDVIVCPGVSVPAFPWADLYPTTIDGRPVDNYMAWLGLTAAITVVGHPVTAVPAGVDEAGMPFGLQLIGPAYRDHRLLSVAAAIEQLYERPRPDLDALRTSSDEHARRLRAARPQVR